MKFKRYPNVPCKFSPSGSADFMEHEYVFDDDERKPILKPTKRHPLSDEIQIRAKGCTIAELIERIKRGDAIAESYMQKNEGLFMDLTEIPANYHDLKKAEFAAQRAYDSLSSDLKAKYGSVSAFITGLQRGDFNPPAPAESESKEILNDESK